MSDLLEQAAQAEEPGSGTAESWVSRHVALRRRDAEWMNPLRAAISERLKPRPDEEFANELLERALSAYSALRASGE